MYKLKKSDSVLKILVPYPTAHDIPSGVTVVLDGVIRELTKNLNVKIIRLIFQSEKISNLPESDQFNEVVDIRNFDNAVDVLKKIQPDLIYTVPYVEFIAISFLSAAKFLKIPTAGLVMIGFEKELKLKPTFFSNVRKIFSNSVPTDVYINKTSFLRRLKFINYKISFMRRTFNKIFGNLSSFTKTKEVLLQSFSKNPFNPELPLSKHFVLNIFQKNSLIKYGFKENDIIITGHPMFDLSFQENFIKKLDSEKSLNILFSPDTLAESGIWSKERQGKTIKDILKTLNSIPDSLLKVKIHPASAKINYYKPLIEEINPKIQIFQEGSIEPYLKTSDFIVVYSPYSTSLIYAMIHRIPIILCNFYDDMDDIFNLVSSNVAIECKNIDSIKASIIDFKENQDTYEINRKNYIQNYLFSDDGKSSQRIASEILKLIK